MKVRLFFCEFWFRYKKLKVDSMLKMLGVTSKKDKSTLIKGLAIGVFAGAFLPDKFNPVVIVKGLIHGKKPF